MTEIKTVSADIRQRFSVDMTQSLSDISEVIGLDMMRYDRTLDAEEEADEY